MSHRLHIFHRLWQLPFHIIGHLFTTFGWILAEIGRTVIFLVQVIKAIFESPFEWGELIIQLYQVGVKSIPIVIIAGVFVGAIVGLQFDYALSLFHANQYLGGVATSALLREVGPVLVSVMIAGRVGAYITAELGTMTVTEQIDAIRCLGANPMKFLVVPRFLAVVVMIFFLTIVGLVVATLGGAAAAYVLADIGLSGYIASVRTLDAAWALFNGMGKGLLFGVLLATISCYNGMSTTGGTEGVGRAVNKCLVTSAFAIFLSDYLIAGLSSLTFRVAESLLFFK